MRELFLITVGKLRDSHLEAIEQDYFKRLTTVKPKIIELKAMDAGPEAEGEMILKKVDELSKGGAHYLILLAEQGKTYTSAQFSEWWNKVLENQASKIFLVIGGDQGHGAAIKKAAHALLSLSPMTLPHQLARVVLVEQLYRAQCIHLKHPYHK